MNQKYRTLIVRDDKHYFLVCQSKKSSGLVISINYDKDWNIK